MASDDVLKRLGEQIRSHRGQAELTQEELGTKSGIVGKYVSEIERGTRDIPLSTLHAIVERGLNLRLDIDFRTKMKVAPWPRGVEEMAQLVAGLETDQRSEVIAIVKALTRLAKR